MKTLIIVLVFCLGCFSKTAYSQNTLSSTGYISPSAGLPSSSFGLDKGVDATSINAAGIVFSGGMIYYFNDDEEDIKRDTYFGIDMTFGEIALLSNTIKNSYVQGGTVYHNEMNLSSTTLAIKMGPIISYTPGSRFIFDLYANGSIALGSFSYFTHVTNYSRHSPEFIPYFRLSGGVRFGYQMMHFHAEYNWGQAKTSSLIDGRIYDFKINQGFLRVGVTYKFRAFE